MCSECSPGGRFLISKVIFTPLSAGDNVAVPTLWPCTFLMSTVTGLVVEWDCAKVAPAAEASSAVQRIALIQFSSLPRFTKLRTLPLQKKKPPRPNLAQLHPAK